MLTQDMKFDLVEKEDTLVGQPFEVTMKVTNDSTEERTVKCALTAQVVYYTGVVAGVIKKDVFSVKCRPKAGMWGRGVTRDCQSPASLKTNCSIRSKMFHK